MPLRTQSTLVPCRDTLRQAETHDMVFSRERFFFLTRIPQKRSKEGFSILKPKRDERNGTTDLETD